MRLGRYGWKRDLGRPEGNQTYNGQTTGLSAESVLGDQSF